MFNNPDFYPTTQKLISKMLDGIKFNEINSVLEPSAGDGRIVSAVIEKFKYAHSKLYSREAKWDIDVVEIDESLQHILKNKGYRIVYNNFLEYHTYKKYDLIVANFPFSQGDKHLLHAIKMQESGGKIVCLLNAETLKNPYSNTRKDLINKLKQYDAEVEYISNAFVGADRSTNVEIALIKIDIPKDNHNSIILDDLKKQEQFKEEAANNYGNIVNADFIKGIIEQYNFEVKAGLKLIAEYNAIKPFMLNSLKDEYSKTPVLQLVLSYKDDDRNCTIENSYIKQIRSKYWEALFMSDQFMGLFTSNLRQKYMSKINELRDYDFNLYNIYTIKIELYKEMIQGVEDTILSLFEEFSNKHHYYNETSKNIHYYNGWKTNKAWKINKKIIIPLEGYRDMQYSWGRYEPSNYKVIDKLSDIEKVFDYLDQGITENVCMKSALKMAEDYGNTKKIQLKYFAISFFKKGTAHIEFTNQELLKKFNLFGSQRLNWIPPSYGKVKYKDMTPEEKQVINEFEGEASYNEVMNNKDYYIVETSKLLKLA